MNKLIVVAEIEEIKLIDKLNTDEFKNIPILVTGVGALNVINALNDIPKDTHIINIGYAGSKNLSVNTFYEVSEVTLNHPNVNYNEPVYRLNNHGLYNRVKCLTGCDFVLKSDIDNCVFDMELAYILALGFNLVSSFKYVSDNLDLHEYRNNIKNNE